MRAFASSCLLLALSAHVAAHPFSPNLKARDETTSTRRYPVVNVDGPDGDGTPPTVTVTKHAPTATVTHRVTDTVVHTKHQPTTIVSVVPVDGDQPDEQEGQRPPVTVTVWETDSASFTSSSSSSETSSSSTKTTTTSTTTTPTTASTTSTRPVVVDPEPEPTHDVILPEPPVSFKSSQTTFSQTTETETGIETSSPCPSGSITEIESPSFVPPPATTTTTSSDSVIETESAYVPLPSSVSEPLPEWHEHEQTTTSTVSAETTYEVPSPIVDEWVPLPSSASIDPTISTAVEAAPSNIGDWIPPPPEWQPEDPSAVTSSSIFSSWSAVPTTFSTATLSSSITSSLIPEITSTPLPDDGLWNSSKYPGWSSSAVEGQ